MARLGTQGSAGNSIGAMTSGLTLWNGGARKWMAS